MEQQAENTQEQANDVSKGTQEQVESTAQTTDQAKVEQSVDKVQKVKDILAKDPLQLTPEEMAVVQTEYKTLQGEYTKKAQELAERAKPLNFAEMVQTPEFLEWAKSVGAIAEAGSKPIEEPEFMQSFTDEQKQAMDHYINQAIKPYVQSFTSQTIAQQDDKLKTSVGEVFTPELQGKMNSLQQDIIKNKGAMFRDELWKILDYDSSAKRNFEAGRQEGLKGKTVRQQANLPQGVATQTTPVMFNPNDSRQDKFRKAAEAAEKSTGATFESVEGQYPRLKR